MGCLPVYLNSSSIVFFLLLQSHYVVMINYFLSSSTGPVFFLSCLSVVVGIAMLYYYRGESPLASGKQTRVCADLLASHHHILNHFSLAVLSTECEAFRCTGPFLHCSAATKTFSFSMLMLGNRKNEAVKLLE